MNPDTISHYRILKKIGSGGMGDVYLAEDTRLNRKVALKLLPREFSKDQERIRRFEREARAVSALNHPYILTIYDIGQVDSSTFIASEFIDGETLRNRMRVAKIPLKEILSIVSQVAEALDAAHRAGIIHRDIKPENIMLRQDGYAKVLDFGLAKLTENKSTSGDSDLETMSSTQPGIVLGTVRYMSPEQARGSKVDARADIFSLGVVLYELITGRVPFDGATPQEMLVAILEKHPSALRTYGDFPEELQWIVTKALAKDVEERYQTAKELLTDLKRIRKQIEIEDELKHSDISKNRIRGKVIKLFVISVLLIAVVITYKILRQRHPPQAKNKSLNQRQITFTGSAIGPEISPDGKFVAYFQPPNQVFVQSLVGENLFHVSSIGNSVEKIRWSPDSTQLLIIVFKSNEMQTFTVSPFGGQQRPVYNILPIACWSHDGKRLASTATAEKSIWTNSIEDSDQIHTTDIHLPFEFRWIGDLDWSITGRFAVLVRTDTKSLIATLKEDGSQPEIVVTEVLYAIDRIRWSWDGKFLYYWKSEENQPTYLMKIEISQDSGKPLGNAKLILSDPNSASGLSFSKNGILAYGRESGKSNIWTLHLTDSNKQWAQSQLTQGTWLASSPSVSPTGSSVAFSLTKGGSTSIFTAPSTGGGMRQLTFDEASCFNPVWSSSGKSLAAVCKNDEALNIVLLSPEGSIQRKFKSTNVSPSKWVTWAPGNLILYQLPGNKNFNFIEPDTGKVTSLLKVTSRGWIFNALVSPDQKKVVFDANWDKHFGMWIEDLSDHSGSLIVPGHIGSEFILGWSSDSKGVYFTRSSNDRKEIIISRINIDTKEEISLPRVYFGEDQFIEWISMAQDEKTFAVAVSEYESDVWITENFDPESINQN